MEISIIIMIVIAGVVLYDIVTGFRRQDRIEVRRLQALQQEMEDSGYCTAHMVMTRLYHEGGKVGDFVPLSVIHATRCQEHVNPHLVFKKYLRATEADLDLLVTEGLLTKRTEENNLARQVWYKLIHSPQIRLAA